MNLYVNIIVKGTGQPLQSFHDEKYTSPGTAEHEILPICQ